MSQSDTSRLPTVADIYATDALSADRLLPRVHSAKRYFLGTHRTHSPEATLARLRPMLPQMGITRVANVTGLDRTGVPVVMVCRPNSRSIAVSQGKGLTLETAKASGVMEAAEVWHAERITRPVILGSLAEVREEQRIANVARLPRSAATAFSEELPILWIEGSDLYDNRSVWVPFELVSANYTLPLQPGSGCFQANTNGLASGNHIQEAICHAICELIERDATTRWKLLSPRSRDACRVDPKTIDDPDCLEILDRFRMACLAIRIWDTTTDVGAPSFVCLLMETKGDFADPEFGAGCHPVRAVALLRALLEAAQARNTYISGTRDDIPRNAWDTTYRLRRAIYCRKLSESGELRRSYAETPTFESNSFDEDLQWLLVRLRGVGLGEAIVVNLTKDSIGIPVVRVIVPGLEGPLDGADGEYVPGPRARRWMGFRG